MEQERRKINFKKTLIILVIILVILLLLIWWFFWKGQTGPGNQANENVPIYPAPSADVTYQPPTVDTIDNTEFNVKTLATMYAERFGSWSTDNQLKNLEQLLPLSSPNMQSYINQQEKTEAAEFYGVTTKALTANVTSQTDTTAEVMVSTQRTENKAGNTNTFYQDLKINMVKSGDTWLVSAAFWQ